MSAAAVVSGNPVLFKPAGPASVVGNTLQEIFREAGLPDGVFNYLPGRGSVIGDYLVEHPDIALIAFTGSTEVAKLIEAKLAEANPEAMLIAETGGLNAMIVDSTALPEQAVRDIVASAFQSAGQRCSALRVLCVQEDIADRVVQQHRERPGAVIAGRVRSEHEHVLVIDRKTVGKPGIRTGRIAVQSLGVIDGQDKIAGL